MAVVISPLIIKLAKRFNVVDQPDAKRKLHKKPIPLMGGLVLFLSLSISIALNYFIFDWAPSAIESSLLSALFLASLILLIGGIVDDKFSLKPWQQISVSFLAVVIMIFSGLKIEYVTNPFGGILYLPATWLSFGLVFFWLLGMTYTTKLLDGIDGLATGVTVIGAIYLFFVSLVWDRPQSITPELILIFVGVCLGFLVWNFSPAKIFLGESGSTILGFWLGVLSIISGAKIATALVVMAVPIVDVVLVIIQRLLKKESPFSHADRKHLHFRLVDAGFSTKKVAVTMYLIAIIAGSLALILGTVGKMLLFISLSLITVIMVIYLIKKYEKIS